MLMYLFFVGLVAAIISYLLTVFLRMLARRWSTASLSDVPAERNHQPAVLGGGLAIFLAAAGTFSVDFFSSRTLQELFHEDKPFLSGLLIAGAWIVIVGLLCDQHGMRIRNKLMGQLIAALILIAFGLQIRTFHLFGLSLPLGAFSIPITILWLLIAINAFLLLNRMDGLATMVGIILCVTLTSIASLSDQTSIAIVGAVIVGSLVGFLRFNLPPASVQMGDAGSMLIGLVIGALVIADSREVTATVGLAAILAICAVPLLNASTAIFHFFQQQIDTHEDSGHLQHHLIKRLVSHSSVLAVLVICCVLTCAGALLGNHFASDFLPLGSVLVVFFILRSLAGVSKKKTES